MLIDLTVLKKGGFNYDQNMHMTKQILNRLQVEV